MVFSGGYDTSICVWNPYTSNLIYKIMTHSAAVISLSIITNTNFLLSVNSEGVLKVIELNKFKNVTSIALSSEEFQLEPQDMTIIPSRQRVCVVGRTLEMFDYDKAYNPNTCDDHPPVWCGYSPQRLQFYTAAGSHVKIWNGLTGRVDRLIEHTCEITAVVLDRYLTSLVIGDVSGSISFYNITNGYRVSSIQKEHSSSSICLLSSISSNKNWFLLSVNVDNVVSLFKETPTCLCLVKTLKISPHTNIKSVLHLEVQKLICIATDSGGVKFFDVEGLNKLYHFDIPEVVSVQHIANNTMQVVTTGGSVRFFLCPTAAPQLSFLHEYQHKETASVVFCEYATARNYICDESWTVHCYDYTNLVGVI